ncbi:MAG: FliG C-terminal domain-containing protein [Elusimicrobiales bacterium]|nr:FliG C-terminal domain-containing protein [Elusimicrobiales bacterium]
MKIKKYFTIALLCAVAPLAAYRPAAGQSVDALRGKVALEAQIEERLRSMLSSYLNTKDIAVAAKVNVQVKKTEADQGGVRKWDEKEDLILPGVPAATSMTKDNTAIKAAEAAKKQVRLGVASVNIWIIVGKQVTKDQETKIKKLVSDAMGLDSELGDTISLESAPAEKASRAIDISAIVVLVCLLVLAVFLYGPFRGFLKRLNENLAAMAAAGGKAVEVKGGGGGEITLAGGGTDDIGNETTMTGALNIAGGGGAASVLTFDSGENMPLDKYVTKDNVDDLMLILHDESPEVIAKVVQRIPQKLAFAAIPRYKMEEVLAQYLKREFVEPEKIKDLLSRIKDKMAGSFGGEARLGNLMQIMDKKSQDSTLSFIKERDEAFAANVATRFFRFEDLLRYDETSIRRVFRKAGAESFARCLKNCDKNTAEAFAEALGPAIRDLVAARMQNMLMTGDSNDSELTILHAVTALAAKGLILPLADVKKPSESEQRAVEASADIPAAGPADAPEEKQSPA